MFSIYGVIWALMYLLYSILHLIKNIFMSLRKKWLECLYQDSIGDDFKYVSKNVKLLNKTPSHLVIIIGNESASYKDLANITVWCIAAGISFISFYDHNGVLKKNEEKLYKVLAEKNKRHLENVIWGKRSFTNGLVNKNGTKNGSILSRKVQVNLYSLADGKGSIVEVAHSLCRSVLAGELKSSEVSQELISKMLQVKSGIPDPDLALCCGPILCTYGFLPWQIRVTEFLQLQTHHNMKVRDFVGLLNTYGKCEQRLGK